MRIAKEGKRKSIKGKTSKDESDMVIKLKSHIHIFTLYSVEEKVSQFFLKKKNEMFTKDFKLLFNLFALQASKEDKTTIPFNHIYRVAKNSKVKKVKDLQDQSLDEFIVKDNKNKMLIYLGEQ